MKDADVNKVVTLPDVEEDRDSDGDIEMEVGWDAIRP